MSLPGFLKDMLSNQYDRNTIIDIEKGLKAKKNVTLRINTIKSNKKEIEGTFNKYNIIYEEVSWFESALIIKNATEEDIKKLEIYKLGKIYLQNLSSMLPPIILAPKANDNILDMAAAPRRKNYTACCYYRK